MIDKEMLDRIISVLHTGDGNLSAIVHRNLDPDCPQEHIEEAKQAYFAMRDLAQDLEAIRALAVLPKRDPLDAWADQLEMMDKSGPEYLEQLNRYLQFLNRMDALIPDDDEPAYL